MPYLILKRSDIPAGTLQVLDLAPNTSQRSLVYDPPGQTKYVNPAQSGDVVLHQPAGGGTPILSLRDSEGLAAWFVTNIDNGAGAALTAAEAEANAAAVIALYAFGDLTSAAGTLQFADINGALPTGAITLAQHPEVLDILAGRVYQLPAGVQVDSDGATFAVSPAVGAAGGPGFANNTLRNIYDTGSLTLSFATGELAGFTDSGFVYAETAGDPNGEAVVVYNDDGTFYTP